MTKSKWIENLVENMVKNGVLQVGEAVPSIREMAAMYDMSVTPVIEAYHRLEERGILQPKSRSKFIIVGKAEDDVKCPPQRQFSDVNFKHIHHILSDSTARFPFGEQEIFTSVASNEVMLKRFTRSMRGYMAPEELQSIDTECTELKAELCKWMYKCNCMCTVDDLTLINGSIGSTLSAALRCCTKPGDFVGVAAPGDINHFWATQNNGLVPVAIRSLPGVGLDLEVFEQCIHTNPQMRDIICNSNFDVPTGTVMSAESKRRLAELCRKHGITIIEDDRYGSLGYIGFRPQPLVSIIPDNTIYVGCINFTGATGMRIHWIYSRKHRSELKYYCKLSGIIPPYFIQHAYAELINSSVGASRRAAVCASLLEMTSRMRRSVYNFFPDGTIVYQPAGGYLVWICLPDGCDSIRLAHRAFAKGITIMPGTLFSDRGEFADHICLNSSVICIEKEWEKGIMILGELVKEMLSEENV